MCENKKKDKQDKRAKALRENLRKRKVLAKEKKGRPPHIDQDGEKERDKE